MFIAYSRRLTGKVRSYSANAELACFLSFIAGAINAGGFLAVQQYTSHMSGIVSQMADMFAIGDFAVVLWGLGALLSFVAGSATTSVLINYARHRYWQSEYALPILVEAGALVFFGLLDGIQWHYAWLWTSLTVATLCYIMGLQNAIITYVSQYALRSTHVTGTVTDIGIEIGKMFYWNRAYKKDSTVQPVRSNRKKFKLLLEVLVLFFIGGIVGAFGFKYLGFMFTCALAVVLVYLSSVPIIDDIRLIIKRFNSPPVVINTGTQEETSAPTLADIAESQESSTLEDIYEKDQMEQEQSRYKEERKEDIKIND